MTDARVKDLNQELFSELKEPLVQPSLVPYGSAICYWKRSYIMLAKQRECFVGVEKVAWEFKATVRSPSSELTAAGMNIGSRSLPTIVSVICWTRKLELS